MKHPVLIFALSAISCAACINGHPTVKAEFRGANYVATVSVVSEKKVPASDDTYFLEGTEYELRPIRTFKGAPPRTFSVFSENSSGRFPMDVHQNYIVFVHTEDGRLEIDNCGNSGLIQSSKAVLAQLQALAKR